MNANKARELAEQNKIKTVDVLKMIESSAKCGHETFMCSNLHQESIQVLMEMGYKISIIRDPYNGFKNHLISWE